MVYLYQKQGKRGNKEQRKNLKYLKKTLDKVQRT
jgi:hypothetical protein